MVDHEAVEECVERLGGGGGVRDAALQAVPVRKGLDIVVGFEGLVGLMFLPRLGRDARNAKRGIGEGADNRECPCGKEPCDGGAGIARMGEAMDDNGGKRQDVYRREHNNPTR